MSARAGSEPEGLPGARSIAARVIERVLRDDAFAAVALDAELKRHPQLAARERALATELVYGCLRVRPALAARLEALAPRGVAKGDPRLLALLLVAAYQILVLERVPGFAAVDEAVGAVRKLRGPRVAGFANALLRRLAASGEHLDPANAILESTPRWLYERLESVAGAEGARALLGAGTAPPANVRVLAGRVLPDWLAAAQPGRVSPRSRSLQQRGDLRKLPGFSQGVFVVQEEGAQAVALALGVRPGERVLDACAGRGQKTSLFAEQLAGTGELWASDLYPAKLRLLAEEFERLHLPQPHTAAVDLTVGPGPIPADFDRVLVDAPCTGVGTLRRRPEIAQRLTPDAPERLGALAERILRVAAGRARPGGRVVFAVCSVLPEEAEHVVSRVSELLEPVPFDAPELAGFLKPSATSFRLLPSEHGTDGYFVASFERRP